MTLKLRHDSSGYLTCEHVSVFYLLMLTSGILKALKHTDISTLLNENLNKTVYFTTKISHPVTPYSELIAAVMLSAGAASMIT